MTDFLISESNITQYYFLNSVETNRINRVFVTFINISAMRCK